MKVGVFGGSFDPPHCGHVLAASYVLSVGDVDRVLVVPVAAHAFDKRSQSFEHRLAMCRAAFAMLVGAEVSDVERDLEQPNYTLRTLEFLASRNPSWEMRLIVGADVLEETAKWHRFDEVSRIAPPLVLGRVGHVRPDAPAPVLPGISSTDVRAWLQDPQGDERPELRAAVPGDVRRYIRERGLYR